MLLKQIQSLPGRVTLGRASLSVALFTALAVMTGGCDNGGPYPPSVGQPVSRPAPAAITGFKYAENVSMPEGRALVMTWNVQGATAVQEADYELQICSASVGCQDALRFLCSGGTQCTAVDPRGVPIDGYRIRTNFVNVQPGQPMTQSTQVFRYEDYFVTALYPGDTLRIRARAGSQASPWAQAMAWSQVRR